MQDNLPFRPLDNSSTTRMKYDLEAAHWQRANESSQTNNRQTDVSTIGLVITALFTVAISLITIISTVLLSAANGYIAPSSCDSHGVRKTREEIGKNRRISE